MESIENNIIPSGIEKPPAGIIRIEWLDITLELKNNPPFWKLFWLRVFFGARYFKRKSRLL